jgi:vitamin B12 transporter
MLATRFLFILAIGASLSAETAEPVERPKPKANAAATVTVTAEASPVDQAKTPNAVKVFDLETIQRSGARNLAELLQRLLPGQSTSGGGVGTAMQPLLGGTRPQDVVVTLDGLRITDASGLGVNLSDLGLAGVARVEVQQGPCSSRFGSDAMGGVIALYTSGSANSGFAGALAIGSGTQGHSHIDLNDSYGWGKGWARFAFQGSREDQATESAKPYRAAGTLLTLGQEIGENHLVTLTYRNSFAGTPLPWKSMSLGVTPRPEGAYDANREVAQRNEQLVTTLRGVLRPGWSYELMVGQATEDRREPKYIGGGYDPYGSRRTQIQGSLNWILAHHSFSLGLEHIEDTARATYIEGQGKGRHDSVSLDYAGLLTQDLRLTLSARHQRDFQNFSFTSGSSAPDTKNSQFTYKAGLNWTIAEGFRVYASGGSAFSNPLLYQVMYNATNAGEALHNEKSRFLQVGSSWVRGRWTTKIEAFRTTFDSAVLFDLGSYTYANGQDLRFQGVEGSAGYRATTWGIEGFWRNQEARDLKAPQAEQLRSAAVLRRPFNTLGLRADATFGDLRGDLGWSWQGPRYETFGGFPAKLGPSRVHFNDLSAAITWKLSPKVDAALRGDHLLQPRVNKGDWLARRTDFHNDAYVAYNFPAQPPVISMELKVRF